MAIDPTPSRQSSALIAGTCYINNPLKEWLAAQWVAANARLNPGVPMLLVDSASPGRLPAHPDLQVLQLGDNLGHLQSTGVDGWGRAMMAIVETALAMAAPPRWLAVWDADVLMTRPLEDMLRVMERAGSKAVSCAAKPYMHWIEGFFIFDVEWLRERGLPARYDWQGMRLGVFPEDRMRQAIGGALRLLAMWGLRDDAGELTVENLWQLFPAGIDYLTHCSKVEVYREIMRRYGIPEAAV